MIGHNEGTVALSATSADAAKAPHDPEGRHPFHFTYDDTGAFVVVTAPNGWTIDRVIAQAYEELGEAAQGEDRIEFDGQLLLPVHRAMKVKAFVEANVAPHGRFHIVSKPGGAVLTPRPHAAGLRQLQVPA